MPSYNSAAYIEESIKSVLSQTYSNWELLITDDGSTDASIEVIRRYVAIDNRIKFFSSPGNQGAGAARNNSIKNAVGRFIAFLDSDDIWHPEKLQKQLKFMNGGNYAFTYTAYQKFNSKGLLGVVKPPNKTTYSKLLKSNVIGCLTVIYDRELLGKRFMPQIRKRQDMALWLELLECCKEAHGLTESLAFYRVDSGMTKNKFSVLRSQWLLYRETLNLGLCKSFFYFISYSIMGLYKYVK